MKPNCPEILYEIKEETPIFHRLELDPTDQNYIYLPSNNMVGWILNYTLEFHLCAISKVGYKTSYSQVSKASKAIANIPIVFW